MKPKLLIGDAITVMRRMPEASVDAIVCDPPYDLTGRSGKGGFMGKAWDGTGVAFNPETWLEALRVLKPGGHLVAAGGSRTFHRLVVAVEDAGFEIRDCITWHFGSGFPKSRNVTRDLESIPPCSCDVSDQIRSVSPTLPTSLVRAGVGTEPGAVPLTSLTADLTSGVGTEMVAGGSPGDRGSYVDSIDVDAVGHGLPIVLGPLAMAGLAESDQVGQIVGSEQVHPEALRDQVVNDEVDGAPAIETGVSVPLPDASADFVPALPLVLPLATPPSRVVLADEPILVVDGHAGSPAIDAAVGPVAELNTADDTRVNPVPLASHPSNSTPERLTACRVCGGRKGDVPRGFGTALKPATEFFTVARKPLQGTVAANVLAYGTGALNIDATRIETADDLNGGAYSGTSRQRDEYSSTDTAPGAVPLSRLNRGIGDFQQPAGRWPANVILDSDQAAALDAQSGPLHTQNPATRNRRKSTGWSPAGTNRDLVDKNECNVGGHDEKGTGASRFFYVAKAPKNERPVVDRDALIDLLDGLPKHREIDSDDIAEIADEILATGWRPDQCVPRFFYCAKAPKSERPVVNGVAHPTVKPLTLVRWLVRLVTPPGGMVLDPFAGSGTTGEAAILEGFNVTLIEREREYVPLIMARLARAQGGSK